MKSNLLSLTALLAAGTLVLAGCCNNGTHNEAKQFCLDNGGTYSVVTSADEEYGECSFPSGIGCRDDILFTDCDFVADTSNIDTEEKRLAGCEENAKGWVEDFENGENIGIEWEDESEGGASFVRNGIVSYIKEGTNWKIDVECVADFVDGSISTSFGEAVSEDETIDDIEIKLDWNGSSDIYSDEDLQAAVDKIANYLDVEVKFQQISYQGDEESANQLSYCQRLNPGVDECVFFKTNFYVPEQDGEMAGALEPNTIIGDYEWYLGRTAGGEWNVLTAGY